jgi:uncharacterized protein
MPGWAVVDSVQFAKQHAAQRCAVAVSEFKRLAQVVLSDKGEFEVGLEGFEDAEGRPCLHLHVEGSMTVTCQRCLEPLVLEIASDHLFVLTEREEDLMDLGDGAGGRRDHAAGPDGTDAQREYVHPAALGE